MENKRGEAMIASVSGSLQKVEENAVLINVNGIGLRVFVPISVINSLGSVGHHVDLHTSLIVREDGFALYGFLTEEEKRIFELLKGVSGIGPRLALAVLNTLSPDLLAGAIQRDDPDVIASVPGVGKKTAQKIVLELKGRLLPVDLPPGLAAISSLDTEIIEAMTTMGFSIVEAQAALQSIPAGAPDDIEERLRLALAYFSQ
jgi:Holliday junction DNA helicase RuvA